MSDRWTRLSPRQTRLRSIRPVVEVLGAALLVGGVVVGIGAFFMGVVFAAQPRDGYRLVEATCQVSSSDSTSAILLVTLEYLDAPWEPSVLYADVSTEGGVHRETTRNLDQIAPMGTELKIPISKGAAAETVESSSLRVGWTSGEPGWYQDLPLALVWDDLGCRASKS